MERFTADLRAPAGLTRRAARRRRRLALRLMAGTAALTGAVAWWLSWCLVHVTTALGRPSIPLTW